MIEDSHQAIDTTLTPGSGDVFADLGFSPTDCHNLRLRALLMSALRDYMEAEGLTQVEAATRLQVSQPRISDINRGRLSRFSLDTLVNMLTEVGLEVDVQVRPPSRRAA